MIKSKEQKIYHVTFIGSKTKLHSHKGGQIMIVTKGQGNLSFYKKIGKGAKKFSIKKTRETKLRPGDLTYIPAKILHTYGSIGKKSVFSHIALNSYPAKNREPKTTWFESDFESKVTDIILYEMIIKKLQNLDKIDGEEGTIISQIFHPHNTLSGIRCSVSHCTIKPEKRSKRHKMKTSEVYYILKGTGLMHIDDESQVISKDDAVYIPPFSIQFIEYTGSSDLKFLCIVDPAWRQEDELILE